MEQTGDEHDKRGFLIAGQGTGRVVDGVMWSTAADVRVTLSCWKYVKIPLIR
jgi:hypothetical protein